MISTNKIRLLHVAQREVADAIAAAYGDWPGLLRAVAGVATSKDLNSKKFLAVLAKLKDLGFVPQRRTENPYKFLDGDNYKGEGLINSGTAALIDRLWTEYHGRRDLNALNRWIHKYFGPDTFPMLNKGTGHMVIEGLKKMSKRRETATERFADEPAEVF
jgi:hypothetical protein